MRLTSPTRHAIQLALVCGAAAAAWTLVGDRFLGQWLADLPGAARLWPTVKPWLLVGATAVFVFMCARPLLRRQEKGAALAVPAEATKETAIGAGVTEYAIYLLDQNGLITSWNAGAARIKGWQGSEVIGKHFRMLFTPEDARSGEPERMLGSAQAEGRFAAERKRARRDGSTYWGSMTITPLRNPDRTLRGFACVSRDITAQHEAAIALADSERLFRIFFTQAAVGIAQMSPEGRILRANGFFCDIVGRSEGELRRLNLSELTHPDDWMKNKRFVRQALAGEIERYELEKRYVRPDGESVWVDLSASLVRDQGGHPAYFVGVVTDITARKEAEAAVDESRARLAGIVEVARDAIITTDADLRIVRTNPAAKEMFALRGGDWIGQSLLNLFPEAPRGQIRRFSATNEPNLRLGGVTGILALRNGCEQFPVEGSILRIIARGSQFFTLMLRDTTERRHYEQAIAEAGQRLQVAVDAAHLGFWDLDLAEKQMFFSNELKRQLGLEEDPAPENAHAYLARIHPDDRPKFDDFHASVSNQDIGAAEVELRVQHTDGGYRDLVVRGQLLRDRTTHPGRMLGTVLDMTPVREAERKIRRLSARILSLQDAERRRIARELHDTSAQNLAALNMNLGRLRRALERERSALTPLVDDSVALADMTVQQIRTMSYLLHPPLLDEFGLERAVRDYVGGFSGRSGIHVDLAVEGAVGRLPDEVELSLFRVLQESLANVVRHSGCTRAGIRLGRTPEEVFLAVSDNGRGIAPGTLERLRDQAPLGVGVTGMTERLAQLGGRLEISSNSRGTTVRASLSIKADALRASAEPPITQPAVPSQ